MLGTTANITENFEVRHNANKNNGGLSDFMGVFGGNTQSSGGVDLVDPGSANMTPTVSESVATGTRSTSNSITESFADFDFGGILPVMIRHQHHACASSTSSRSLCKKKSY